MVFVHEVYTCAHVYDMCVRVCVCMCACVYMHVCVCDEGCLDKL